MAFQRQAASIVLALVARRGTKSKLLKLFLKYGQARCRSEEIFPSNGSKVTKGAWHLRMMTASVVMSYVYEQCDVYGVVLCGWYKLFTKVSSQQF